MGESKDSLLNYFLFFKEMFGEKEMLTVYINQSSRSALEENPNHRGNVEITCIKQEYVGLLDATGMMSLRSRFVLMVEQQDGHIGNIEWNVGLGSLAPYLPFNSFDPKVFEQFNKSYFFKQGCGYSLSTRQLKQICIKSARNLFKDEFGFDFMGDDKLNYLANINNLFYSTRISSRGSIGEMTITVGLVIPKTDYSIINKMVRTRPDVVRSSLKGLIETNPKYSISEISLVNRCVLFEDFIKQFRMLKEK